MKNGKRNDTIEDGNHEAEAKRPSGYFLVSPDNPADGWSLDVRVTTTHHTIQER
jgi:hypothetical protein